MEQRSAGPDDRGRRQGGRGQRGDGALLSAPGLLLPEPDKPYGSIRRYEAKDVARVKFVKAAQRLGFSLDEVAGLLKLDDGTHCDEARQLAEAKLGDVRKKLKDLRRIESALAVLVRDCCSMRGKLSCPLITTLQRQ
jgi:MerR family mercuric resistance operon transcriptional regulator